MILKSLMLRSAALAAAFAATATAGFAGRQGRLDLQPLEQARYAVEGDAFVGHNGELYCNRPLYCNHIYAIALGGDKPYAVLGSGDWVLGNLMFGLVRNGKGLWLQEASDITSKYRPGRMEWIVKDSAWGATTVHVEEVPAAQGPGVVAHIRVDGALPGDALVWASGAATPEKGHVLWAFDAISQHSKYLHRGFVPSDCEQNRVSSNGLSWTVQSLAGKPGPVAVGTCSAGSAVVVADADKWQDAATLTASQGRGAALGLRHGGA